MTSFEVGFLMGGIAGVGLALVLSIVHAWWDARPRDVDFDDFLDRARRL